MVKYDIAKKPRDKMYSKRLSKKTEKQRNKNISNKEKRGNMVDNLNHNNNN